MFRSHLPTTKNSHSQNVLTVVTCLCALVLGPCNASQPVTPPEQERQWDFTNSTSFGSNVVKDLSSEGHYTTLDETIQSATNYNLEEFQTTDRNIIEASGEEEIWSKIASNSAVEATAFLLNVQTKQPETTQNLERVQHDSNVTLAPNVPGCKVVADSGNASQSNSYERNVMALSHSAADIAGGNEQTNNDFKQTKRQASESMTSHANISLLNMPESMECQNEHSKNYPILEVGDSEYENTLEGSEEIHTVMKKVNKVLFKASKNKNVTFIDGNNKSDSFSQNIQETAVDIHVNTTRKEGEKLSEIRHKQVTTKNKDKTEIEHNEIFTMETTDKYSEVVETITPGGSPGETVFGILKLSQNNISSRTQYAEIVTFLSKLGIESGQFNVSKFVDAESNKNVNIPNKHSRSNTNSTFQNMDVQNQSYPIAESKTVPMNIETSTDTETSNVSLRHGPVFTSPEINKVRSSNSTEDNSRCKEPCSSTTNISCSCLWTCTFHGTCCEDISEHCPSLDNEDSKMLNQLQSSIILCRDGHILVSSCHADFSSDRWEEMKTRARQAVEHSQSHALSWWLPYVDENMNDTQLRQR